MLRKSMLGMAVIGGLVCAGGVAGAEDAVKVKAQTQAQTQAQEQVYGSQLMTRQERMEYHNRMRAAKTLEERERIRKEHHAKMQLRAKERGVTLPEMPPVPGGGMGPGRMMGPGGGMGPKR